MDKVQKALAKLYFALGEQQAQSRANADISALSAECQAYLAIRGTGGALGCRYFAMGAAAASRKAAKPPGGKRAAAGKLCSSKLPGGGNVAKKPPKKSRKDWDDDFGEEEDYE